MTIDAHIDIPESYQAALPQVLVQQLRYASLDDYVDTIDAAVRQIGIDHVGISSDFNHGGGVTGFAHVGEAQNVTRELLESGYDEAQIRKLWAGISCGVLRQAEKGAVQQQSAVQ